MEGCHFSLTSNPHALWWILSHVDAAEKLAGWRLSLLEYDLEIVHRAVVKYQVAHELSRLPTAAVENNELEDGILVMVVIRMKNHDQMSAVLPCWTQKKTRLRKNPYDLRVELPTLSELIIAQSKDVFYEQSRQLVGLMGSAFTYDKNGGLVRKGALDGSVQKLLPTSLRLRLL